MRKGRMRKGDREELKTHEEEWKGVVMSLRRRGR